MGNLEVPLLWEVVKQDRRDDGRQCRDEGDEVCEQGVDSVVDEPSGERGRSRGRRQRKEQSTQPRFWKSRIWTWGQLRASN